MDTHADENTVIASVPYPTVGAYQYLTIVHCNKSQRPPDERLFLPWQELGNTVLASAFCPGVSVQLPTFLPAPNNLILLPPISKNQLRPELVKDEAGTVLGMMLRIPGFFVHANRILTNYLAGNSSYDYQTAVVDMVKESSGLLSNVVRSNVLRVRSHPGIMAHALELPGLAMDEIGISVKFAEKVLKKLQDKVPLKFGSIWDLDGFPCYGVRFPVANRYGVQEMYLRILPDDKLLRGKYIGCNAFNLAKLWLGDRDGDMLFSLLRWEGVMNGDLEVAKRPRVEIDHRIREVKSCTTLQGLLDPTTIPCEEKLQAKMETPDLSTLEMRMQYIKDADTRTHVATYTMVFGWWVPRVLAASKKYSPREAYQLGNDLLEIFIEWCMDARKGGSPLSDPNFDSHKFMRLLRFGRMNGEDINFIQLRAMGVPDHLVQTLEEAWNISDGKMASYCGKSPFYQCFVIGRNNQRVGMPKMLLTSQMLGVTPDRICKSIVDDLTARKCLTSEEKVG